MSVIRAIVTMPEAQPEREPTMRRSKPQNESFAHFYLTKVALGEGCGCAEHATRLRELEDSAGGQLRIRQGRGVIQQLRPLFAKLGAALHAARVRTPRPE